jgi:hypothetical protein
MTDSAGPETRSRTFRCDDAIYWSESSTGLRRLSLFVTAMVVLVFVLLFFDPHPWQGGIMSPLAIFLIMAPTPFFINLMRPKRGTAGPVVEIGDNGITVQLQRPRVAGWSELDLSRTRITAQRITLRYRHDRKDPIIIWRKCYEAELVSCLNERIAVAAKATGGTGV